MIVVRVGNEQMMDRFVPNTIYSHLRATVEINQNIRGDEEGRGMSKISAPQRFRFGAMPFAAFTGMQLNAIARTCSEELNERLMFHGCLSILHQITSK